MEHVQAAQSTNTRSVLKIHLAHGALEENVTFVMLLSDLEFTAGQIFKLFLGQNGCSPSISRCVQFLFLKKLILLGYTSDKLALNLFLMD